jgi:hypothetical protein
MSTDENLIHRGYTTISVCILYFSATESTEHLFFLCPFVADLWNWLGLALGVIFYFSTLTSIF